MSSEAAFRDYLEKVHAALSGGDAAEGERLAKAVTALVRAERDVAEYLREAGNEDDDPDALRAELQSRFARFIDAGADHRVPGVPDAGAGEGSEG